MRAATTYERAATAAKRTSLNAALRHSELGADTCEALMTRSVINAEQPPVDQGFELRGLVGVVVPPVAAAILIGNREIRAMFRLGRTAAYELTHRPGFPAPIRISARCYRWWATDVTAFAAGLRQQAPPVSRERSTRRTTASLDVATPRITGRVRMAQRPKRTS